MCQTHDNVQRYVRCLLICQGSPMGHALHCLPFLSVWWDDWNRRWPFSGHGQPECAVVPFGLYRPCCSAERGVHQAEQRRAQMSWAALSSPGLAFAPV